MIALDPHAAGDLPVEKYKALAEREGFLLIGSENSQNGQGTEETKRILRALKAEALDTYRADPARIVLAGFSGGARAASLAGLYFFPVDAVIGCGAGFPQVSQRPLYTFDYFAIVGDADFNLAELVFQDPQLAQAGWNHQLLVEPGGHAWPGEEAMAKAWSWTRTGTPLPAPALSLREAYGIDRELAERETLANDLAAKDSAWWAGEIRSLNQRIETGKTAADTLVPLRIKGFLGVLAYGQARSLLSARNLPEAKKVLVVYKMLEPNNPAPDSLRTIYHQLGGK
jgi:hypothetical protein